MAKKKNRKPAAAPTPRREERALTSAPMDDKGSRTVTGLLFLALAVIIAVILAALESVKTGMLEG